MRVAVVGAGYVGLVHGTCLAELGHRVVVVESDPARLATLTGGGVPIYEPGLAPMVARNRRREQLRFTASMQEGVASAEVVFVCVGTPPRPDGSANLSMIERAVDDLAPHLESAATVAIKSTVPVGTTTRLAGRIAARTSSQFSIAFNPEFLREGRAVADCTRPERIVIGVAEAGAQRDLERLYASLLGACPLHVTSLETAELSKYAANAMLAVRIGLMNEIAEVAEDAGASIDDVAAIVGSDSRIGPAFLAAGPGFGGSCFPKDLLALSATSPAPPGLTHALIESNHRQQRRAVSRLARELGSLAGKRVAVWGLSFKAGTDDVRCSPSLVVIDELLQRGARVSAADPLAWENARDFIATEVSIGACHYAAAAAADALVVMTEWPHFAAANLARVARSMRGDLVVDTRRVLSPLHAEAAGLRLRRFGVGDERVVVAPRLGQQVA